MEPPKEVQERLAREEREEISNLAYSLDRDYDSITSAFGLKEFFSTQGIKSQIIYNGKMNNDKIHEISFWYN